MSYPFLISPNSITVILDGVPKHVHSTHENFQAIREAIKAKDWERVPDLIDPATKIIKSSDGRLEVKDDAIFYDGHEVHNTVVTRILAMIRDGFDVDPLIAFLQRLLENPSSRAVSGLYDWLERSKLPVMPDGRFVAYKIVRDDFMDVKTGTFDNSAGEIVEQPRWLCDDNPDQTCSTGLHFCSAEYLPHYGVNKPDRRVMAVAVDPADVVAFPRDYNISKGRCCRYEVLHELPKEEASRFFEDRDATLVYRPSRAA